MAAPLPATSRRLIDSYGGGGFTIGGQRFALPIIVWESGVVDWPLGDIAALRRDDFAAVLSLEPRPSILLLGSGERAVFVPPNLREELRAAGLTVDAMGTGAACRTYNILAAEERPVAAALIPVG